MKWGNMWGWGVLLGVLFSLHPGLTLGWGSRPGPNPTGACWATLGLELGLGF